MLGCPAGRWRSSRARRHAALALACASGCTLLGAAPASALIVGPPLPAPHVGVPLSAPAAPPVAGAPAEHVTRRWERCWRYGSLVTADRPAHHWPLDETGGPTAFDVAGDADGRYLRTTRESVDGALVGETRPAAGFDGRRDAVTAPGAGAIAGREPYAFELWVQSSPADDRYRYLVSQQASTATGRQGTGVWLHRGGLGFERYVDGAKVGITVAAGLPAGRWSHVVASYDGATMRLFVDGRQVGSRSAPAALRTTAAAVTLGAGDSGRSGFLAGVLDEVALYDRALPRAHVAAHRAAGIKVPCTTIAGANQRGYTPVAADLGHTLRVTADADRTTPPAGSETLVNESTALVDDGGQLVRPTLLTPTDGTTVSAIQQVTASVAGLPLDRIEFLVDGVVRYAKGEAPFQYTWRTTAESNGRHVVAVRAYGPGSSTPVTAQVTVTVSNRTVYPTPLPLGRESMYAEFNEGDLATAENLLDNVWPARGFPLPKLGWPLTWQEDPYDDAYWRFYHYGLRPLSSLLYLWETTDDRRYLDKLIAILRSYVAYDATRSTAPLTFDNNHAAAYRAMVLVNLHGKLARDRVLPADVRAGIEASLARLGRFMADPAHFEGGVNHGFNEGAALLLIADNFPSMPGASGWRTTAIDRLREMLDTTLDADGVEVENSPFYHVYVLGIVYQIAEWAKLHEPALASSYGVAAQRMLRYAAYVTQPSGYLPMLGATATTYLPSQDPTVYGPMADADPEFAFAYTRGARGTAPPNGTYLFPSSGPFLMRSPLPSPSALPQQTFVTFDAGPYRTEHSDLDALGITMYSSGSTVLPESGLFTYTAQPDRAYFHGTRSHNTVVVDDRDQAAGAAVAGPHGSVAGATWARGTSGLSAGATHRRSVVVLRQGLTLVVDRLTATGATSHRYAQTWHLPPDATTEAIGADVVVRNGAGTRTLAVRQATPAGLTLQAIKGRTSPTMQGWYSSSFGAKVPAHALEYTRQATNAAFATLLAAGPYAAQTGTVRETAVSGGTRVDVCVGGTVGYAVTVPTAESAAIGVTSGACAAP